MGKLSPPVRGAWIETSIRLCSCSTSACRPPCGGRGLKPLAAPLQPLGLERRPPCGGRGLKRLRDLRSRGSPAASPPVRGAWIETRHSRANTCTTSGRPPCGGRGLKHRRPQHAHPFARRPPCGGRGATCGCSAVNVSSANEIHDITGKNQAFTCLRR
jgi:hypothetical protein